MCASHSANVSQRSCERAYSRARSRALAVYCNGTELRAGERANDRALAQHLNEEEDEEDEEDEEEEENRKRKSKFTGHRICALVLGFE